MATAVYEQFNALKSFTSGAYSSIQEELSRRGLYSEGVKEMVSSDWTTLTRAEKQYEEVMGSSSNPCRRSDLTTPSSMRLYASSFNSDATLSQAELVYISGDSVKDSKPAQKQRSVDEKSTSFVKKANRLGIRVAEYKKPSAPSLFPGYRRLPVQEGFEQINDGA